MYTSSSGRSYGSGLRSTECTMLNMAVLAPMPNASVAITSAANAGRLHDAAKGVLEVLEHRVESHFVGERPEGMRKRAERADDQPTCGVAVDGAMRSSSDARYHSSPLHSRVHSSRRRSGTSTRAMRTTRMHRS